MKPRPCHPWLLPAGGLAVCFLACLAPARAAAPSALPGPTRFDPTPRALGAESAEVLATAYSPDGETLASGGADKLVRLWDVATGKVVATLQGHSDAVSSLV